MSLEPLFTRLDSAAIANLISTAKESVCYAAPGIQMLPAQAICDAAKMLGPEMVTLCIDFNERVIRMGYGDLKAVELLQAAEIVVRTAPGLRTALIIVDRQGFIFTPTALYLEAEPFPDASPNALRLSPTQVTEALARLSPAARAIAKTGATTDDQREWIDRLPVEVDTLPISCETMAQVTRRLKEAPPVKFDVARQVRVYSTYFQYVELKLTGAAIQHHRLTIPPRLFNLGDSKELEGRLHTQFDLIANDSVLSSQKLLDELRGIRDDLTRSLGKKHGRVVLKSVKPLLEDRLAIFRENFQAYQHDIRTQLQTKLDESRKQIIKYYLPRVHKNPPDAMRGQIPRAEPTEADAEGWLNDELCQVFPTAESLIDRMQLEVRYKDVTFETLNEPDFLRSIKAAFPRFDWKATYEEFRAAGEAQGTHPQG